MMIIDINVNFFINKSIITLSKWPEQLSKMHWCMVRYHHTLPHLVNLTTRIERISSYVHFSQFNSLCGRCLMLDVLGRHFFPLTLFIDVSLMFAVSM